MVKAAFVLLSKHRLCVVQRQERYDVIEVDIVDRQAFKVLLFESVVGPNLDADNRWHGGGVIVVHEFVVNCECDRD